MKNEYVDPRERKKIKISTVILALSGLISGILGFVLIHFQILSIEQVVLAYLVAIASFYFSAVIYQLGKLVGGIYSGYRMVYFRIGGFALCQKEVPKEEDSSEEETGDPSQSEQAVPVETVTAVEVVPSSVTEEPALEGSSEIPVSESAHAEGDIPSDDSTEIQEVEEFEFDENYELVIEDVDCFFTFQKFKSSTGFAKVVMVPPAELNYHYIPYRRYLRWGCYGNFISMGIACFAMIFLWKFAWILGLFAFSALVTALKQMIPLHIDGVANDGYLRKLCEEDSISRSAFVNQLFITNAKLNGVSIGDMPEAWFYAKFDLAGRMPTNPLVSGLWLLTGCRFLIHGEIFQGKVIFEALSYADGLVEELRDLGLYYFLYSMILEGRVEQVKIHPIPKKLHKLFPKREKTIPLYSSYSYAYGKLVAESGKRMKEATGKFEKIASRYPLEGEIEDFRLLMDRLEDVILMK